MTVNLLLTRPKTVSRYSARRLVLLGTTILTLGAAALIVAPNAPQYAVAQNVTQQAQTVARPVGFADVVEKVKPAVISVRVKMNAGPQLSMNDGDNPFSGRLTDGALLPPVWRAE